MSRKSILSDLQTNETTVGSPLRRSSRILSQDSSTPKASGAKSNSAENQTDNVQKPTRSRRSSVQNVEEKPETKSSTRSKKVSILSGEETKKETPSTPSRRSRKTTVTEPVEEKPKPVRGRRSSATELPTETKPQTTRGRRKSVDVVENQSTPRKSTRRGKISESDESSDEVKPVRGRRSLANEPTEKKPVARRGRRASVEPENMEENGDSKEEAADENSTSPAIRECTIVVTPLRKTRILEKVEVDLDLSIINENDDDSKTENSLTAIKEDTNAKNDYESNQDKIVTPKNNKNVLNNSPAEDNTLRKSPRLAEKQSNCENTQEKAKTVLPRKSLKKQLESPEDSLNSSGESTSSNKENIKDPTSAKDNINMEQPIPSNISTEDNDGDENNFIIKETLSTSDNNDKLNTDHSLKAYILENKTSESLNPETFQKSSTNKSKNFKRSSIGDFVSSEIKIEEASPKLQQRKSLLKESPRSKNESLVVLNASTEINKVSNFNEHMMELDTFESKKVTNDSPKSINPIKLNDNTDTPVLSNYTDAEHEKAINNSNQETSENIPMESPSKKIRLSLSPDNASRLNTKIDGTTNEVSSKQIIESNIVVNDDGSEKNTNSPIGSQNMEENNREIAEKTSSIEETDTKTKATLFNTSTDLNSPTNSITPKKTTKGSSLSSSLNETDGKIKEPKGNPITNSEGKDTDSTYYDFHLPSDDEEVSATDSAENSDLISDKGSAKNINLVIRSPASDNETNQKHTSISEITDTEKFSNLEPNVNEDIVFTETEEATILENLYISPLKADIYSDISENSPCTQDHCVTPKKNQDLNIKTPHNSGKEVFDSNEREYKSKSVNKGDSDLKEKSLEIIEVSTDEYLLKDQDETCSRDSIEVHVSSDENEMNQSVTEQKENSDKSFTKEKLSEECNNEASNTDNKDTYDKDNDAELNERRDSNSISESKQEDIVNMSVEDDVASPQTASNRKTSSDDTEIDKSNNVDSKDEVTTEIISPETPDNPDKERNNSLVNELKLTLHSDDGEIAEKSVDLNESNETNNENVLDDEKMNTDKNDVPKTEQLSHHSEEESEKSLMLIDTSSDINTEEDIHFQKIIKISPLKDFDESANNQQGDKKLSNSIKMNSSGTQLSEDTEMNNPSKSKKSRKSNNKIFTSDENKDNSSSKLIHIDTDDSYIEVKKSTPNKEGSHRKSRTPAKEDLVNENEVNKSTSNKEGRRRKSQKPTKNRLSADSEVDATEYEYNLLQDYDSNESPKMEIKKQPPHKKWVRPQKSLSPTIKKLSDDKKLDSDDKEVDSDESEDEVKKDSYSKIRKRTLRKKTTLQKSQTSAAKRKSLDNNETDSNDRCDTDISSSGETSNSSSEESDSDEYISKGKSVNQKSKLDKILDQVVQSEDSDSDIDETSANNFLDDMAEEGEEDTPSEDSNQIIDRGESIGSSNFDEEEDSDDDYEEDSFICDDEEGLELLSGDEYDLGSEQKRKKSRIINSDELPDDEIIKAKKPKIDTPKRKSRIFKYNLSSSEDELEEFRSDVLRKEKEMNESIETTKIETTDISGDIQQAKESSTSVASASNNMEISKSENDKDCKILEAVPNKPSGEISPKEKEKERGKMRKSSLNIQENIVINGLSDPVGKRIHSLVDSFCSAVSTGEIALNISLEYEDKSRSSPQTPTAITKDATSDTVENNDNSDTSSDNFPDTVNNSKLNASLDTLPEIEDLRQLLNKKTIKRRLSSSLDDVRKDTDLNKSKKSKKPTPKDQEQNQKKKNSSRTPHDPTTSSFSLINQLVTDVKNRPRRTIKPSQRVDNSLSSWVTSDAKNLKPSTSPVSKKEKIRIKPNFHPMDFKNQMLSNSSRVKRIETKTLLKKKGVYN